jgi:hypothetical protein
MDGEETPRGEREAVVGVVEIVEHQSISHGIGAGVGTQLDLLDPVNLTGFGQLISPVRYTGVEPVVDAQDELTIREHESLAKALGSMAWLRHVPVLNLGRLEP